MRSKHRQAPHLLVVLVALAARAAYASHGAPPRRVLGHSQGCGIEEDLLVHRRETDSYLAMQANRRATERAFQHGAVSPTCVEHSLPRGFFETPIP